MSTPALLFCLLFLGLSGCGDSGGYGGGGPEPEPTPDTPAFVAIKPVVERACGGCHNGQVHPLKLDTEARWKGSKARARLEAGTMPPGGRIDAGDKAALLAYFKG